MSYTEIFAADCESTLMNESHSTGKGSSTETGTWITDDSKQPIQEVVDYTCTNNLGIIFVSTRDVYNANAKNQDKEGILHEQKQLTLQECAVRVSLVRRRGA